MSNSKSILSLGLSLAFHAGLLFLVATATYDYFVPEGVVTTIEFTSDSITQGEVDGTLSPVSKAAVARPKPVVQKKPAPPKPTPVQDTVPEVDDIGVVPVAAPEEVKPEIEELDPEIEDVVAEEDNIDEEVAASEEEIENVPIPPAPIENDIEETRALNIQDEMNEAPVEDSMDVGEDDVSAQANNSIGLPDKAPSAQPAPPPSGIHGGMPLYREGELKPIANPNFKYPRMSQFLKEEGIVKMRAYFNEQGVLSKIEVYGSSGYERLDLAAANGAKSLRFKPLGVPFVYDFGTKWALNGNTRFLQNRAVEKYKRSTAN